jgi:putative sigma-54 modulation protein
LRKSQHVPGEVTVQVKGKNISISASLRDLVTHKLQKLDKYLDRLDVIEVELATEQTRDAGHHNHVEATTHVAGKTIRVASSNANMAAAVDDAVDKLYRQLNRTKERMKAHHNSKPSERVSPDSAEVQTQHELSGEEPREPVVLVEYLEVKPLFEDEALLELEEQGKSFYVFLNARNEQVNVLYRHGDGTYGLIEPRLG